MGGRFWVFIGNGSVLSRAERHIGRSLRFRWWGHFFNQHVLRTQVFRLGFGGLLDETDDIGLDSRFAQRAKRMVAASI